MEIAIDFRTQANPLDQSGHYQGWYVQRLTRGDVELCRHYHIHEIDA